MSDSERTILLLVEFDGTDLHGWQQQVNARTVQRDLRGALRRLTGDDPILRGSSRTDAGVHALGLPVSFRTRSNIPMLGFLRGLNAFLPEDISIVSAEVVPDDFDARDASLGKRYRYDVWSAGFPSATRRRTTWWVKGPPLDADAMALAARPLVGKHDFSSFRAAGCDSKSVLRRLTSVEVSRPEPHLVRIEVVGNAFLRNMVRIIAGTLVEVGRGRRSADQMGDVLAARVRSAAGQTAPAQGLTLVEVFYDRALLRSTSSSTERERA